MRIQLRDAIGSAVLRASVFAATGSEEDSDEGNIAALNRLVRTIATKNVGFLTAPSRVGRVLGFFISNLHVGLR
jgi:hypothetical protein